MAGRNWSKQMNKKCLRFSYAAENLAKPPLPRENRRHFYHSITIGLANSLDISKCTRGQRFSRGRL